MQYWQWILAVYLCVAPIFVSLAQISVLKFPTENPFFLGMPYSPFPQVFYFPIFESIFFLALSFFTTLALKSQKYRSSSFKIRLNILGFLIVINAIIFWFGINLAQRAVILEYLSAIDANGLHFLRLYMLPIMPEVFPENGEFAFKITMFTGIVGLIGIFTQYFILFNQKNKKSAKSA